MATLQSIAPIFPTADLEAMRAHYEALGFAVHVHGGGYGTAARDGVRSTSATCPTARPPVRRRGGRLPRRRRRRRAPRRVAGGRRGRDVDLFDPGFGVWEAAHTDADGNLLRFGSPLAPVPLTAGCRRMGQLQLEMKVSHLRPAAYLTANATSRSLATSCAKWPGGFLLGRQPSTRTTLEQQETDSAQRDEKGQTDGRGTEREWWRRGAGSPGPAL